MLLENVIIKLKHLQGKLEQMLINVLCFIRWYMKLKCANCGEIPDHWQYIDQTEKQPLKGGRGEACAVIKCKVSCLIKMFPVVRFS